MRQVTCTSKNGAPVYTAQDRDGGALIFNSDVNNTVWLGKDASITSNYVNTIPLPPQSWLALDGQEDVYGVCQTGQTVTLNIIDGGQSFFQSGITSGGFQIGPNGLFIYGTTSPHFGTPPIFSATPPGSSTDPFGNPVVPDAVTTYNAFGAAINSLSMLKGAFFQYRDLGSSTQGILILSIASIAGTDSFGNSYPVGQFGQDPFGQAIQVVGSSISLFDAVITAARGGRIKIVNAATNANNPWMQVDAPEQVSSGHMQILMQGTSPDGTQPSQMAMGQVSGAGGLLTTFTQSMMEIQANVSANDATLTLLTLAAGDPYLGFRVVGDTSNRIRIDGSAPGNRTKLRAGPGNATQDTGFYNSGVAEWASDAIKQNNGGSAETWHLFSALGYLNGWLDGTDALPSYKFAASPDNSVSFVGSLTAPVGVAAGQSIATLAAAYRPNNLQMIAARNKTGNIACMLSVGPAGTIAIQFPAGGIAAGNIIQFEGRYYLDR